MEYFREYSEVEIAHKKHRYCFSYPPFVLLTFQRTATYSKAGGDMLALC